MLGGEETHTPASAWNHSQDSPWTLVMVWYFHMSTGFLLQPLAGWMCNDDDDGVDDNSNSNNGRHNDSSDNNGNDNDDDDGTTTMYY